MDADCKDAVIADIKAIPHAQRSPDGESNLSVGSIAGIAKKKNLKRSTDDENAHRSSKEKKISDDCSDDVTNCITEKTDEGENGTQPSGSNAVETLYKDGIWARCFGTTGQIAVEITMLSERQKYTTADWQRPHTEDMVGADRYSPSTFIVQDIPVALYSFPFLNEVGLLYKFRTIPAYFYDGSDDEQLTNKLDFSKEWLHNPEIKDDTTQLNNPTREQIVARLRHLQRKFPDFLLPWNEGLLRYGIEDVVGILVPVERKPNIENVALLREGLKEAGVDDARLRLYGYDDDQGSLTPVVL